MEERLSDDDEWLGRAREATGLELEETRLTIVDGILEGLNLTSKRLYSLPDTIGQLTSLTELDLNHNFLGQKNPLPENIWLLVKLAKLNLSYNKLTSLPDNIGQLTKLTRLDLSNNLLDSLPESIGNLSSLKFLDLRDNNSNTLSGIARRLLPRAFLRPDDDSLLRRVQKLTLPEIRDLSHSKLMLENGELVGLDLSNLGLIALPENFVLPENIVQLKTLTELDLTFNRLASLPESIGSLKSLTQLHLSENRLLSLPESIGDLKLLTKLALCNNQLASLPDSIGSLESLTTLRLDWNQLASLPETMGQLTNLEILKLNDNKLTNVPSWIGKLTELKNLNLSDNRNLYGSLPPLNCKVEFDGTNISSVRVKRIPVKSLLDRLFVILHVLIGYLDVLTDVLSIIQFQKQGNKNLMAANIVFLLFNVCVDVSLMPDVWSKVLALLQVQQTVQAYESLDSGRQTEIFVKSKKVDAICRSVPSIVLQLYGLLATLPALRSSEGAILVLSVVTGVIGSAISLGTMAAKSGLNFFSVGFAVHFCYYVCELTARLLSMSLLFVSIGPIAFAVLGADFLMRLLLSFSQEGGGVDTKFLSAVLAFGSDGFNAISLEVLKVSSTITSVVLLISLCLVNLLDTPDLRALREASGRPVQAVTALACVALFFKYLFGVEISNMKVEDTETVDKRVTILVKEVEKKDVELRELRTYSEKLHTRTLKLEDQTFQLEARLVALEEARSQGGALDRV